MEMERERERGGNACDIIRRDGDLIIELRWFRVFDTSGSWGFPRRPSKV